MKIIVEYIDKNINEKLEINFNGLDWFGLWIANNYKNIEIIDIIQQEE